MLETTNQLVNHRLCGPLLIWQGGVTSPSLVETRHTCIQDCTAVRGKRNAQA